MKKCFAPKTVLSVLFCCCSSFAIAQKMIFTIAGGLGDNLPAAAYGRFSSTSDVSADNSGNLYVADEANYRVRKVSAAGIITTVAGTGSGTLMGGTEGVGRQAIYSRLTTPHTVLATGGEEYIGTRSAILKINKAGTLELVAGDTLTIGFSGDGSLATLALLNYPERMVADASGNIYFVDRGNYRVRKINTSGIITTVAGGSTGAPGDGGPAIAANIGTPSSVAIDPAGNIYISDDYNNVIRKVDASGIISTIAGGSFSLGDGGPATAAGFDAPIGLALDKSGNLYISDCYNNRIRMIDLSGIITTVAGDGTMGFTGDGGPANIATLHHPGSIDIDASGNLYIADVANFRIRMVDTHGLINTYAGNALYVDGYGGDGKDAHQAMFENITDMATDKSGNVFIADNINNHIRRIDNTGTITNYAGSGIAGFLGDGFAATAAALDNPSGLATDNAGNLYVSVTGSDRIRKIDVAGTITTFAGGGFGGLGDGGPATDAKLTAYDVAVDAMDNIYIADKDNYRVRKVTPAGIITTVAGTGVYGYTGDGAAATDAALANPIGVAVDKLGNIFILVHEGIKRVNPSGIISTINYGTYNSIAADDTGAVYVIGTNVVNMIDTFMNISAAAGNGEAGYMGDLLAPVKAELMQPHGLAVSSTGDLLIGDITNVRRTGPPSEAPTLHTIAPKIKQQLNSCKVYPNPAGNEFTIQWTDNNYASDHISIMDPGGRIVFSENMILHNHDKRTIATNALAPGTYFISISSGAGAQIQKITIIK